MNSAPVVFRYNNDSYYYYYDSRDSCENQSNHNNENYTNMAAYELKDAILGECEIYQIECGIVDVDIFVLIHSVTVS